VGESARFVPVREIADAYWLWIMRSWSQNASQRSHPKEIGDVILADPPSWLIPRSDVVEVNRSIKRMKRHCPEERTDQSHENG
jgi:hypothetical protein